MKIREQKHDFSGINMRNWNPNGSAFTGLLNNLSLLFPQGERFFIKAVREHLDSISDEDLLADAKIFVGQEGRHTREHIEYNKALENFGYNTAAVDVLLKRLLHDWAPKVISKKHRLLATVALEHYTATLAEHLLSSPEVLGSSTDVLEDLWSWHATEEVEHSAVSYDVYAANYDAKSDKEFIQRIANFVVTSAIFLSVVAILQAKNHELGSGGWASYLKRLGHLMQDTKGEWLRFFDRNFHPKPSVART